MDQFSESLETVFGVENTVLKNSFMRIRIRDPEIFEPGTGMEKLGSVIRGINTRDPQQWFLRSTTTPKRPIHEERIRENMNSYQEACCPWPSPSRPGEP
jgi:hypothetical protein